MEKTHTVFILGAGASAQAGVPVMADFLDVARNLQKSGRVRAADEGFKAVFKGISALQQVHSKSQLDIQNVESVFSAFEMARTLRKLPGVEDPEEIERLGDAMRSVIVNTIEQTLQFKIPEGWDDHRIRWRGPIGEVPEPYEWFASLIQRLQENGHDVSIITFNYDIAIDFALWWQEVHFDYALRRDTPEPDPGTIVRLLKLHGSLNWAECPECLEDDRVAQVKEISRSSG